MPYVSIDDLPPPVQRHLPLHAREIYLQAGRSHAMPPGNVSEIEPKERKAIVEWYRAAVSAEGA